MLHLHSSQRPQTTRTGDSFYASGLEVAAGTPGQLAFLSRDGTQRWSKLIASTQLELK